MLHLISSRYTHQAELQEVQSDEEVVLLIQIPSYWTKVCDSLYAQIFSLSISHSKNDFLDVKIFTNWANFYAKDTETALFEHSAYGPDILHKVPDEKLKLMGISLGDAIGLKEGSQCWWMGSNAKRKHGKSNCGTAPNTPRAAVAHVVKLQEK